MLKAPAVILLLVATSVSGLLCAAETLSVSARDINHFVAGQRSGRWISLYRIELAHPLIRVTDGNEHVLDIRIRSETLDIVFAWDVSANELSFARVPWDDIRSHQVRYGLPEFYDPNHLPPRYKANPLPGDSLHTFDEEPLRLELASPDVIGAKRGEKNNVYLFKTSRIVKLKLPKQVLWEAELPRGHALIAFDVSGGLLWIATNSNQGSVDGELGLPLATTQVYAISALMPEVTRLLSSEQE